MYIFSYVVVEGRVVDSNMNGFSSKLFADLVYYLEVGYVHSGMVIENAVFVNCTGNMIIVFFYPIFQTSTGFSCAQKVVIFFWAGPFVDYSLFQL